MHGEKRKYIITIDGPAGSGKSTVAKKLAEKLKASFLSSGKIYRTFAYFEMKLGYERAKELIENVKINESGEVFFESENLDEKIKTEEVGQRASELSKIKEVREIVNKIQRKVAYMTEKVLIAEGRDEGTEVFPEADIKIYLEAPLEERAKRKYLEQKEKPLEYFLQKIKERDEADSSREISPLRIPKEAYIINTISKTPDEVVDEIIYIIQSKTPEILHSLNEDSK